MAARSILLSCLSRDAKQGVGRGGKPTHPPSDLTMRLWEYDVNEHGRGKLVIHARENLRWC